MKAHKYWSLGALAAMIGTFYTGCIINSFSVGQIGMNRCSGKTREFHNLWNLFS